MRLNIEYFEELYNFKLFAISKKIKNYKLLLGLTPTYPKSFDKDVFVKLEII